jgi:hypothetical protein
MTRCITLLLAFFSNADSRKSADQPEMPRVINPSPSGFRAIQEIGTIRASSRFSLRIPDKPDWEE